MTLVTEEMFATAAALIFYQNMVTHSLSTDGFSTLNLFDLLFFLSTSDGDFEPCKICVTSAA